ncbi:hypothetical protein ACQY0O_003543 [Thecaphora frezii]
MVIGNLAVIELSLGFLLPLLSVVLLSAPFPRFPLFLFSCFFLSSGLEHVCRSTICKKYRLTTAAVFPFSPLFFFLFHFSSLLPLPFYHPPFKNAGHVGLGLRMPHNCGWIMSL